MSIIKGSTIRLSTQKNLKIKPVDGKRLKIDTSSVAYLDVKRDDQEGHIISISLEGKYDITLGDKFSVNIGSVESVYEVKYMVVEKGEKSILLFSSVPTRTTKYLLPLLGRDKKFLRYHTYFVNAFLDEQLENLLLLYRFTGTEIYKMFESKLMNDPLFVGHVEHDNYHVVYKFHIPKEFKKDVDNFIDGKFSLFSKKLKRLISKFYGGEEGAAIMMIVNKDEELRKKMEEHLKMKIPKGMELSSKPETKLEIYESK